MDGGQQNQTEKGTHKIIRKTYRKKETFLIWNNVTCISDLVLINRFSQNSVALNSNKYLLFPIVFVGQEFGSRVTMWFYLWISHGNIQDVV